jgi:hypothetical protein
MSKGSCTFKETDGPPAVNPSIPATRAVVADPPGEPTTLTLYDEAAAWF